MFNLGMRFGCFLLWAWHTICKGGIPSGLNGKERPEENKLANSSEQQKSERTARPSRPHVPREICPTFPRCQTPALFNLFFPVCPSVSRRSPCGPGPLSSTHVSAQWTGTLPQQRWQPRPATAEVEAAAAKCKPLGSMIHPPSSTAEVGSRCALSSFNPTANIAWKQTTMMEI